MKTRDDARMDTPREPILFVSGAGLAPWIWDDVRRALGDSDADRVAARPAPGAALREYADAAIESAPPGRFAVVAHSAGGVVAAEMARLVPERVSGVLAVSAVIPRPGASFIATMPAPNRWILDLVMRISGTRPPESAIRGGLARGLDAQTADRIVADFVPESRRLYLDRTAVGQWRGWTGYVLTTQDREVPVSLQRRCAQNLGAAWTAELPTGHLPMVEDPQAVAGTISRFFDARTTLP
jgi:pimeloyl-ACP methyl ester carboxylesterase